MSGKAKRRLMTLVVLFFLVAVTGLVKASEGGQPIDPAFRPGTTLEVPQEFRTSKENNPSGLALPSSTGVWSTRAADHARGLGMGLLVGAAVAVGIVAVGALLAVSAPVLAVAAVGALVGGALYGLFTGAARFNPVDAAVQAVIGGVSAGVGFGLGAAGVLAGRGLLAARAAVDVVAGGLGSMASYLIQAPDPSPGGAAMAFGLGAGTAGLFLGAGYGFARVKGALGVGGGTARAVESVVQAAERESLQAGSLVAVESKPAVLQRVQSAGGQAAKRAQGRSKPKLVPDTPEHKAVRWPEYQARGGKWSYDRWSKQYDVNMRNASHGIKREVEYREAFGGTSTMLRVPKPDGEPGFRQVDIFRESDGYAGQLKTGYQYLSEENVEAIRKDVYLVSRGLLVEWILEKGGSKPLIEALETAGVDYHIGPKIPR